MADEAKKEGITEADLTDTTTSVETKEDVVTETAPVVEVPTVDYKAELEKELENVSKKLSQAEFLLKQKNIDEKKHRDIPVEVVKNDDDVETPSVTSENIDEKLEQFKLDQLGDFIDEAIASRTQDPDEKALIEFHFKNSIKRTGDTKEAIRADIEKAQFLANKPRFEKLADEFVAKQKAEPTPGGGSASGVINGDVPETNNLSDSDRELLTRFGVDPSSVTN